MPWFLKGCFDGFYSTGGKGSGHRRAVYAYVEAMGALGNHYHNTYEEGRRDVVATLSAAEANLLHARRLARMYGWWDRVICAMQGLHKLYGHTGRNAEWARLVEELVSDLVDPATGGPLPGREEEWSFLTSYRVDLTRAARDWPEAERLQRAIVERLRSQAAAALDLPPETLDAEQRNQIRNLAVAVQDFGHLQREQSEPSCVESYEEAADLSHRIGGRTDEAKVAFNVGHAYMDLPAIRDLNEAERWYQRSLDMFDEGQRHDRAKSLGQLGVVAFQRFQEARVARRSKEELSHLLNQALRRHVEALKLLPDDAVHDLAVTHQGLGNVYAEARDIPNARRHYGEAIRYFEQASALYQAAQTRFNLALLFAHAGRLEDGRLYAQAALRNLEGYGEGAAPLRQEIHRVLALIEQKLADGEG